MKRGDKVTLVGGGQPGTVMLTPSEVDGMTMCMVSWSYAGVKGMPRYTWERIEDLVLC